MSGYSDGSDPLFDHLFNGFFVVFCIVFVLILCVFVFGVGRATRQWAKNKKGTRFLGFDRTPQDR